MPEERVIDRFRALDAQGRSYTIVELEQVNYGSGLSGRRQPATGGSRRLAVMETGDDVNELDDGSYEIVMSEVIVRRVR